MEPRISVITLGVADVPRARAFYEALGWPLSGEPEAGVAFFRNAGSRLALYALDGIAEEAGQTACAARVDPHDAGDERREQGARGRRPRRGGAGRRHAVAAGPGPLLGRLLGLLRRPDGHAWEVAFNPFWPIGEDGLPQLP